MKKILWIATLLLTASCNGKNAYESKCLKATEKLLRSPSTLQIKKIKSYPTIEKPSVFLDYDAANAFGTPIRSSAYCKFKNKIGKDGAFPDLEEFSVGGDEIKGKDLALISILIKHETE